MGTGTGPRAPGSPVDADPGLQVSVGPGCSLPWKVEEELLPGVFFLKLEGNCKRVLHSRKETLAKFNNESPWQWLKEAAVSTQFLPQALDFARGGNPPLCSW